MSKAQNILSHRSNLKSKSRIDQPSASQFSSKTLSSKGRRKKKATQWVLAKRANYRVLEDHLDRTPKLLNDPDYQVLEEWQPSVLDYIEGDMMSSGSQLNYVRSSQLSSSFMNVSLSLQPSIQSEISQKMFERPSDASQVTVLSDARSPVPSAFYLKFEPSRPFYPPHSKALITCRETSSFTIFSLESKIEAINTAGAKEAEMENEFYLYLTQGKGKFARKITTSEQQTNRKQNTSTSNMITRPRRKNKGVWVTTWMLYDYDTTPSQDKTKKDAQLTLSPEEQFTALCKLEKFNVTLDVMERWLAMSVYGRQQLAYRKKKNLVNELDVEFTYSLEPYWKFAQDEYLTDRCVSDISFNRANSHIIAVGYGRFSLSAEKSGYVCVWNIKNTVNPERSYKFDSPVSCLDFSHACPNWLGVGFLDGNLFILDITSTEKKIMFKKESEKCRSYERINSVNFWYFLDFYNNEQDERIMMTCADGKVIQLRRRLEHLVPFELMRTHVIDGEVKGIKVLKNCEMEDIPIALYPPAITAVRLNNNSTEYFVPTEEGVVHKATLSSYQKHGEVFRAHSGPIYSFQFSPFSDTIFLTCGADGVIRIWILDIYEPLITLQCGWLAVTCAAWSPVNATLIACTTSSSIMFWDLRRRSYTPCSVTNHPTNTNFTCFKFSPDGLNLIVGDVEGAVHVFGLQGMPFDQIYKTEALMAALRKELRIKPKIWKQVQKIIGFDEETENIS